jgi:hypothetical protein
LQTSKIGGGAFDKELIWAFPTQGIDWERIASQMGVGIGTIYRVAVHGSKTPEKVF